MSITKLVYTFDVDEDGEISNIKKRFTTDGCGFGMHDFHTGLEDLEYDKYVPANFGKEDDGT